MARNKKIHLVLTEVEAQHVRAAIDHAQAKHIIDLGRVNPVLSRVVVKFTPPEEAEVEAEAEAEADDEE